MLLARSTNGGQNFNQVATVTTDGDPGNLHTAMVTTRADAGGADDVLVVWARVGAGGERIQAALSTDAGATFPTTIRRSTMRRDIRLPQGRRRRRWNFPPRVGGQYGGRGHHLHDTLNGTTLANGADVTVTAIQITDFAAATSRIPPQPDRGVFSVSTIDVNRTTGRIVVSYTDRTSTATNDTNIFVRFSDNGGATWSVANQVNDDGTTTRQFLPRLASTTSKMWLTWYDARNDATNTRQATSSSRPVPMESLGRPISG